MASALTFKTVYLQGQSVGIIRVNAEELLWTAKDGEANKKVPWDKVEHATWAVFGKYGHLRLFLKAGKVMPLRFDGFSKDDYAALKEFFKGVNVKFSKENIDCSGANFGHMDVTDTLLQCSGDGKSMFDVNVKTISQCVLPGNKRGNDVELQFHESDDVDQEEAALVSMRLYLPPGEEGETGSAAEYFQEQVMEKTGISDVKGNVIVEFDSEQGTFLTPRGRYSMELFASFIRMHGAKYDYKIQYDDINCFYLLPKADERHMAFIISLDKPIRQGQQRYQHLVLQTNRENKTVELHMEEEELKKYAGLNPEMEGPLCNIIAKIFKEMSNKPVYEPKAEGFKNVDGSKCVTCSLSANEGFLYPLRRSFIFIHKPTQVIKFADVESIEFQRYGGAQGTGNTRGFDLKVDLKSHGGGDGKSFVFSGINKTEYGSLYSFLNGKQLRIRNIKDDSNAPKGALAQAIGEMNGQNDSYMQMGGGSDGEDDESEEDDDYAPPSDGDDDDGGGSGSDSDGSGGGSSDSDGGKAKAKAKQKKAEKSKSKAKPEKRKREDADSGSDESSDEEGGGGGGGGGGGDDSPPSPKKAKASASQSSPKKASSSSGDSSKDKDTEGKVKAKKKAAPAAKKGKGKKKKKKKDPNAPKNPSSAFMFFSKEQRPNIVKEQPDLKFGEVGKALGVAWREITPEKRAIYDEMVAKDKIRYKEEMETYVPPPADPSSDDDSDDSDGEEGGGGSSKGKGKTKAKPKAKAKAQATAPAAAAVATYDSDSSDDSSDSD